MISVFNTIKQRVDAFARRSAWFNEEFRDCVKMADFDRKELDVVNLGSSSAFYAFDYSDMNLRGANWALRPNYLAGDEVILRNFSKFLKEGSRVIISISPFALQAGDYRNLDDRFYTFVAPSTIANYSRYQRLLTLRHFQSPAHYMPLRSVLSEVKRLGRPHGMHSQLLPSAFSADAKRWIDGWLTQFGMNSCGAEFPADIKAAMTEGTETLERIVDECWQCHAEPVMVMPPVSHDLARYMPVEVQQRLWNDIVEEMARRKGVRYLNHFTDPDFITDSSLFLNAFFLNEKGARKFTRRVMEELGIQKNV